MTILYMEPKKIYFHNGALYGLPHYIGAIRELSLNKPDGVIHYYGNSAGAACALACYLVLNGYIPIDHLQVEMYKVLDQVDTITLTLTPLYCQLLDIMVPYWPVNLAERVSGILHVGVSTKTQHKFVNQFNTNADIYNALMCSGTLAGLSNYESVINGEVCLDGAYMFGYEFVPTNSTVIASDIRVPLSLTCPPRLLYPWLEENGRRNIAYGQQNPLIIHYRGPQYIATTFFIHKIKMKDPQWEQHIEEITRSKITR
jgi:hypothetical protein